MKTDFRIKKSWRQVLGKAVGSKKNETGIKIANHAMNATRIHVENQVFNGKNSWNETTVLENLDFIRCRFESCFSAPVKNPKDCFVIRNVQIQLCTEQSSSLHTTRLENILIDGLLHSGRSLPFLWACVFKRVIFRGVVVAPKLNEFPSPNPTPDEKEIWRKAAQEYYRNVDWALDLREAKFKSVFDLPGVPVNLVRRDPASQFVLRRSTVLAAKWKPAKPSSVADIVISLFLASGLPEMVAVVGKASRNFKRDLESFQTLRNSGVIEPD